MFVKLANWFHDFLHEDTVICDPVRPIPHFDPSAYMGLWYEIAHAKEKTF